jgi:pseudouridine-5'-phosphate glycosidase
MIRLTADVAEALQGGVGVVALESSVLAQGLPIPANRTAAERMVSAVRAAGAVPAVTGVVDGMPAIGLSPEELERFLAREGITKVTARDLAAATAQRRSGATTVAATLALIARSGVRVFATGGIGGVHRESALDESADLGELACTPRVVVCAGAKSILDLPATFERLETLSVPVIGYCCDEFPAFFSVSSGLPVSARVESVEEIVEIERAQRRLGRQEALLVVQPPPAAEALDSGEMESVIEEALRAAAASHIRGAAVTPFLLAHVERATAGRSRTANLALLESNALLAGRIAVALARAEARGVPSPTPRAS